MMRLIWYRIVAVVAIVAIVGARRVPSFAKVVISLAIWLPPSDKIIAFCIDRFSKVDTVRRSLVHRKAMGTNARCGGDDAADAAREQANQRAGGQ